LQAKLQLRIDATRNNAAIVRSSSVAPQGINADRPLLDVFLHRNHDSRPTVQIFADASHGRESLQHPAV